MFKNLKALRIDGNSVAEYTLYQLEGEPVLELAPATEANKPYFNALLKRSRKNQQRLAKGAISAELIKDNRENDRDLYPEFIIRNWHKMPGDDGFVPFNQKNCQAFVEELPDWLFDEIRIFAGNPESFVEEPVDVEETAGNLPSD